MKVLSGVVKEPSYEEPPKKSESPKTNAPSQMQAMLGNNKLMIQQALGT